MNTAKKAKGREPQHPEVVPLTALEEKQQMLAHHVRMVARRLTHRLFVAGMGGLGKSKVIGETLTEEGINPVLLNAHVTPLSLYESLYHHRQDRVLWIDDADSIYASMPILGLLRAALWPSGEGRVVTYSSTQLPNLPGSFTFDSRIIFTANCIPKRNEAFKAVLSRVDCFELTATPEEIVELMRATARKGFESLTPAACLEVVDFIAKAGGTRQLSMRLYEASLRKVLYAASSGADWRDLVRAQLDQLGQPPTVPRPLDPKGHARRCLALAVEKHPESVKMQEEVWREMTGLSRASFFRCKRESERQDGTRTAEG